MSLPRWTFEEWETATLVILRRDGDRCSWCGKGLNNDAARHHRMRRKDGGDRLSNVVLLHTRCHVYVHAHPDEAKERGVIVPPWEDLLTAKITTWRGTFYLADDGTRHAAIP
jgi:hypothetical protein